jgi:heme a synthase
VTISNHGRVSLSSFAWFTLAYNVAVVLWGAYVRATGSGAGCGSHWPLCNGEFLPLTSRTQTLIEFTHRATSGLSLFLVATLLVWSWRRTAKCEWPRYSAVAAAVLLFNEAILGAMLVVFEHVGMDRSASRAVFLSLHFGNTLLLVAALTLTAKWLSNSTRRFAPSAKALERAVIAIGLFCVVATGMTGTLAALGDAISPSANLRNALVQDFSSNSHVLLRLRTLHPMVAAVAVFYVLWMVRKLSKNRERSSGIFPFLTATLLAQVALGVLNVLLLAPVWLQLTHLLVAEVLWILLVLASADLSFSDKTFRPSSPLKRGEATSPAPSDPRAFAGALVPAGRITEIRPTPEVPGIVALLARTRPHEPSR